MNMDGEELTYSQQVGDWLMKDLLIVPLFITIFLHIFSSMDVSGGVYSTQTSYIKIFKFLPVYDDENTCQNT